MKYFLLKTDDKFDMAPDIMNWYSVINPKFIRRELSHNLPRREVLLIRENTDTVFTDVIHRPFFLVTTLVRDVIKMYEPATIFKEFVLLDRVNAKSEIYYIPILEYCDCLSPQSELSRDRSVIKKAVIDASKIQDRNIFYFEGVGSLYAVANLDFVESILRRGARGVGLEEVNTVQL